MVTTPADEWVTVAPRVRLHARRWRPARARPGAPFLLVHGLASNARVWDGVAARLARDGYTAVAVDLRGHGVSDRPGDGYGVAAVADDVAALCHRLELRTPILAGQSWGGNVVLEVAVRHPGLPRALALLDGGWIHLSDRFANWDDCWAALAPPAFTGLAYSALRTRLRAAHPDWPQSGIDGTLANLETQPDGTVRARLRRDHHRAVLRSLWEHHPRERYPHVAVPVLLMPAGGGHGDPDGEAAAARSLVLEARAGMTQARIRWYPTADHDLHAQYPNEVALDLETLA